MSLINKIKSEPSLLNYGIKFAHMLKKSIVMHQTNTSRFVLAIDPNQLQSAAKKYRPDAFTDMKQHDTKIFSTRGMDVKISTSKAQP